MVLAAVLTCSFCYARWGPEAAVAAPCDHKCRYIQYVALSGSDCVWLTQQDCDYCVNSGECENTIAPGTAVACIESGTVTRKLCTDCKPKCLTTPCNASANAFGEEKPFGKHFVCNDGPS